MKLSFAAVAVTLTLFSAASFALTPGTYHASYPGINGKVPVSVSFSKDKILSITVDGSKETPGIGQTAASTLPKKIVEAQSLGVDGVSGAQSLPKPYLTGWRTASDRLAVIRRLSVKRLWQSPTPRLKARYKRSILIWSSLEAAPRA